jgi:shikimate kinase
VSPILVLVGPPGAGKTTVGALLAQRLGIAFRDTDADVEAAVGKPIADIFVDDGEEAFRAQETAALLDALAAHDGVLALGGGAVLAEANRDALAGHRVAFLSVELADAAKRVGLARDRPVISINPRARLRQLLDERRGLYAQVADVTIRTDGRSAEDVADELARRVTA